MRVVALIVCCLFDETYKKKNWFILPQKIKGLLFSASCCKQQRKFFIAYVGYIMLMQSAFNSRDM
jgi:hypothetical protein